MNDNEVQAPQQEAEEHRIRNTRNMHDKRIPRIAVRVSTGRSYLLGGHTVLRTAVICVRASSMWES